MWEHGAIRRKDSVIGGPLKSFRNTAIAPHQNSMPSWHGRDHWGNNPAKRRNEQFRAKSQRSLTKKHGALCFLYPVCARNEESLRGLTPLGPGKFS